MFDEDVSSISVDTNTNLVFTGDVMLARNVELLMNINGNDYPLSKIPLDFEPDYLVGNFEASIPKVHTHTQSFTFAFSVPSESLSLLNNFGFTHLGLANNHSYDFGGSDYFHTRTQIEAFDMVPFGDQIVATSTSVAYIEVDEKVIALVGIYAVYNDISEEELTALFFEVNLKSDEQIVYVHWGEEYKLVHSNRQEELAKRLVARGADMIVGHHPHVVQDVQMIDGVPVFYSLGNFIFDQYFSVDVQQGLLLDYQILGDRKFVRLIPVSSIGSKSAPYLMSEADSVTFLNSLAERSDISLQEQIRNSEIKVGY